MKTPWGTRGVVFENEPPLFKAGVVSREPGLVESLRSILRMAGRKIDIGLISESRKAKSLNQRLRLRLYLGAQERTRTSTVLPPPGPEPGASTNFATWALPKKATL